MRVQPRQMPRRGLGNEILAALAGGPMSTRELAEKLDAFPWTMTDSLSRLRKAKKIEVIGKTEGASPANIWKLTAEANTPDPSVG